MANKPATIATFAFMAMGSTVPSVAAEVKNIVLVHGMNMDGTSWRPVYDILSEAGYHVTIVQEPLTGFDDDVRAAQLALDKQEGAVVLVGHSYGGMVISAVGNDPKVQALVYVAAFQPDAGETTGYLSSLYPSLLNPSAVVIGEHGFVTINREGFLRDVAHDLSADDASFLFDSQAPTTSAVFTATVQQPAWKQKPSFGIIATGDRIVSPALQRWMYERAGSPITEIKAGHMLYISQPKAVAAVIMAAAKNHGN